MVEGSTVNPTATPVLVTVNPAFRAHEVEYVLNQSNASGIFVLPEFRGNPLLATIEEVRPRCPELREVIRFDEWDAFLASGDDSSTPLPEVKPEPFDPDWKGGDYATQPKALKVV